MQGTSKEHKRTGSTSSKSCLGLWSFRFGQGSCLGLGAAARKAQFEPTGGLQDRDFGPKTQSLVL